VASTDDARVAAGIGGTDAEKLVGRGDFLLIASGQIIRFQAAYIRPEEIAALFASPVASMSDAAYTFAAPVTPRLRRVK
jgi:S-DNA-T family DNA segregation ATPase FtsK/SpoIIIE